MKEVALRDVIKDYYGSDAQLKWDPATKTASIYGAEFSAAKGNAYINSKGVMIVDDTIFVKNPLPYVKLDYHPVRDGVAAGVTVGSGIYAGGLIVRTAGPAVSSAVGTAAAPIINKAGEIVNKAGDKISSVINSIGNKATQSIGNPFVQNGLRLQNNVDPRTLTPGRDISSFTADSLRGAWEYYSNDPNVNRIVVDSLGKVWDGNHRLAYALQNNLPVNIKIGW